MAGVTDSNKTQVAGDIFCEFLEVAVHCILYNRGLYPAGVFEKRKKYNVPVQMCIHPEVTSYIANVVDSVRVMLESKDVEKVAMVILDQSQNPLERFVFEIGSPNGNNRDDHYLFRLEESLRAFLLKLNVCDSQLKPLPEDCSWVIHVHTKESAADRLVDRQVIKDFYWVEADEKQTQLQDPSIQPLKTMNNELIKMQLYVEESSLKDHT